MKSRKVSPELLQKIRDSVNLTEVVGEHVVLKKSGANSTGLCPFHSERSPSFSVSDLKQLYHCYGCKKGGDLFSFVMEIYGISFPEAIEELADRARVALPKEITQEGILGEDPETQKRRAAYREKTNLAHRLNRFVAAFYHQTLSQSPAVLQYLGQRGVHADLVRSYYVGCAPDSWDALTKHLIGKKAPIPLAAELGLIRPSVKGGNVSGAPGYFDLFRHRAMFPILDLRGKVAGFGGRMLQGSHSGGEDGPKYLNSVESMVFHKGKLAFGLFQAQKHIREKNEVILVEGYFDVLALNAAGFYNVVSTCGTALTPDHLNLFRKFADRITVLFDGDKAGTTATERAMETGLEHGVVLYGAVMPQGLDPDELLFDQKTGTPLAEGTQQMKALLADSKPMLDVKIEEAVQQSAGGAEARTQALKKIGAWLAKFKDPVGKEVRIQSVESTLKVSRQLLNRTMGEEGRVQSRSSTNINLASKKTASTAKALLSKLSRSDVILLTAMLKEGDFLRLLNETRSKMPPDLSLADLFESTPASEFVAQVLSDPRLWEGLKQFPGQFLNQELDPQVRSIVTEALVSPVDPIEGGKPGLSPEEFKLVLERSLTRVWARFSQRIKAAIADAEAKKDAGLQSILMKEYLDVQRKMKEFINFYDEA